MPSFFVSIAFSFIAWSVVAAQYIWPELRLQPRAAALRPLLILHSFRFMGLAFLVPGVVSRDPRPMGTSLRRFSHCFLWRRCQVGQALSSHGCSIFGAQPIF